MSLLHLPRIRPRFPPRPPRQSAHDMAPTPDPNRARPLSRRSLPRPTSPSILGRRLVETWDPKITTPPGLYVFSHVVNTVRSWGSSPDFEQTTEELRFVNVLLLYFLLVALYLWSAIQRREVSYDNVLQREFCVAMFPLFFFFSGLY